MSHLLETCISVTSINLYFDPRFRKYIMQMNTPFIYKSSPICCSHQLQVRYDFTMMNSLDVASLVGDWRNVWDDWRNVWEPQILDVGYKEESSKALQSKLEGIFLV